MRFSYDLFGAYLDALTGLEQIRQDLVNRQSAKIAKLKNTQPDKASEEFIDLQPLDHRFAADQLGREELLHRSTQGDFKRRTAPGGLDARFLSQMLSRCCTELGGRVSGESCIMLRVFEEGRTRIGSIRGHKQAATSNTS